MTGNPQNTLINAANNPGSRNLKEMATLPMQNIPIPDSARQIGQTAFESQVDPFRRGFKDRVETTIGETARRGIAFGGSGGPGAQRVDKLIEKEQALESDIAKNIGSTMGMTLQDQAFQSSEAAKRFEESKEFADYNQGLQYGKDEAGKPLTQLEAKKNLAEFIADLDVETQELLGDIGIEDQKDLFKYTFDMESEDRKSFATFMSGLDTEAKKEMATFFSGLEVDQAKTLATFMSGLDYDSQTKIMDYTQKLRGGTDENGEPLDDVAIAQKLTDIQTKADETTFTFKNSATRGVNPDTGEAYTDEEMGEIAVNLAVDQAERIGEVEKDISEYVTILDRGTDEDGNPLTQLAVSELTLKMGNRLKTEFATKAFENAAIAEFGANGVDIANDMASLRGDSMIDDLSMLEAVDADTGLTEPQKNDLTKLILSGAGWESEPVRNIIENSDSTVVATDFTSVPDQLNVLRTASSDLKEYLVSKGFGYNRTAQTALGIEIGSDWEMWQGEPEVELFNELWESDPEFRRQVKRG